MEDCKTLTAAEIAAIKDKVQTMPLEPIADDEVAVLETNMGKLVVEFFQDKAPNHCQSFKRLVKAGFYDCTKFHRILKDFVIQGGDINTRDDNPANDGQGNPGYLLNAEFNDIPHDKGILSMARSTNPNSAGSQFFIVLGRERTKHLDKQYTVFGKIIEGLDVVDKIAGVETTVNPGMNEPSVPVEPVYIVKAYMAKKSEL